MNQPISKKQIPLDILQVYAFLQEFREDLTDVMRMTIEEWSAALRDDIRAWKNGECTEPGWQCFRDWLNDICQEEAMPPLFPEPTLDPKFQESPELTSGPAGFVAGKGDAYDYLPPWMQIPPLYHNEHNPNPLAIIKLFTLTSSWTWLCACKRQS